MAMISGKFSVDSEERTNVHHVFAVGDVLEGKQELTPVAIKTGRADRQADRQRQGQGGWLARGRAWWWVQRAVPCGSRRCVISCPALPVCLCGHLLPCLALCVCVCGAGELLARRLFGGSTETMDYGYIHTP